MKSFLLFLIIAALPFVAAAQLISNPNPPVAAAQAVGGAYTAVATGAEAPYWNPAGLAYGKGTDARFAYQQIWGLSFVPHFAASASTMLPGKAGGIAVTAQNLSTRNDGYTMASETEIALSHGIMLQKDIHSSLALGYSLKLISYSLGESVPSGDNNQSIDLGSASTFGLDVGATAQLWDRFLMGCSFKNINSPQLGENHRDLPRIFSGGLAYSPYYGVRTTFDVERALAISGQTQFKGGVNANIIKPLDLRFGVRTNPNNFSAGFGLHWRELVLDYAFIYHAELSPTHLIGIGFNVDKSLSEIGRTK